MKALVIGGANFANNNVGVVTFVGREPFEPLLLHRWKLLTNGLDDIGIAHLVENSGGAMNISAGLTVGANQDIYANLSDGIDQNTGGVTVALRLYPVQKGLANRMAYAILGQQLGYTSTLPILGLASQSSNTGDGITLKKGGSTEITNHGTMTLNAWNTIIFTASKTEIKLCVNGVVSSIVAPGYPGDNTAASQLNPLAYTKLHLGSLWSATPANVDSHKTKQVRLYNKYMSDSDLTQLSSYLTTL